MDISANLVTPQQLENFATQNYGTDRANQDQWCYMLSRITGSPCPDYDVGNGPDVMTSADDFLTGLRNFQLGVNATLQGPGGSGAAGPAVVLGSPPVGANSGPLAGTTGAAPMGAGLLGPTNCKPCIWLKQNPWALLAVAAAVYFAFFYKK